MQAERAQAVPEKTDQDRQADPALAEGMAQINARLDQLVRLMDEQVHLQKVALLEQPGNILRFNAGGGDQIALSLPDAQDDYVQRVILRSRNFYEPRLLASLREAALIGPGDTVCDVGANIGNHAVYFGKVLGARRVLAFEPQPHCHRTLCRNLELNGLTEALAYNCLVGASSGRGEAVRFNARNLGATAFRAASDGPVPMVALDDLMDAEEMQGLSFIKIDVEGMQMEVLKGARKLLKTVRPALWIELLERDNALPEAAAFLKGFGYAPERIGPNDYLFRQG